jgi:hypothetical protein
MMNALALLVLLMLQGHTTFHAMPPEQMNLGFLTILCFDSSDRHQTPCLVTTFRLFV